MEDPAQLPTARLFVRAHTVLFPRPRIFPLFVSLSHSVLFALNTTSCPFVLPMKSFTPAAFPERVQFVPALAAAQRALPEASEVRTYPLDAPESILRPWNVPVPATSSSRSAGCSWQSPPCSCGGRTMPLCRQLPAALLH